LDHIGNERLVNLSKLPAWGGEKKEVCEKDPPLPPICRRERSVLMFKKKIVKREKWGGVGRGVRVLGYHGRRVPGGKQGGWNGEQNCKNKRKRKNSFLGAKETAGGEEERTKRLGTLKRRKLNAWAK